MTISLFEVRPLLKLFSIVITTDKIGSQLMPALSFLNQTDF